MANITLLGASYPDVPAVELPTTGGGISTFYEVDGSDTVTANGTYDVTALASIVVNVAASGGTVATATVTNSSNTSTSLHFTVAGEPKLWMVINTGNITLASGYYYISSIVGGDDISTRGTYGYYKSGGGSSRYVYATTSYYSGSYSGGTFTVSSSASRSSAGGSFYNTSYMLIYLY